MKKSIIFLLCLLFAFPLIACDKKNDDGKKEETVKPSYVEFESFDGYGTIDRIWFANSLADASLCKEKDYVSAGDGSLRVEVSDPALYKDTLHSTYFLIPTVSKDADLRDFSMTDEITFDVYGESGEDLTVTVSLVQRSKSSVSSPSKTFGIKSGEWNKIEFPVNRTVVDACIDIRSVTHVRLELAGINAVMYVDNMRLHNAVKEFAAAEITLDENEICDFEKAYQGFAATALTSSGITPSAEINTDPQYASSGIRSLKVVSPKTDTNTWLYLELSSRMVSASGLSMQSADKYILYDVYKPFARTWWTTFRLINNVSGAYTNVSVTFPEGTGWHTACISLSNAVAGVNVLQFSWQSKSGLENGGNDDTEFYIDNIRIADGVPDKGSIVIK